MRKMFLSFLLVLVFGGAMHMWALTPQKGAPVYDQDGFVIQPIEPESDVAPVGDSAPPSQEEISIDPKDITKGELASCFDYYTFGSIHTNLMSDFSAYQPGSPVMITGVVKNTNRYPVVGLDIKARLVKNIPSPVPMRAEVIVLDEFDIAENITIDANAEYQVSYTHILPLNAPAGQYEVYIYAVEQDRFNLSGLYFTNDIVSSRISFNVTGNNPEHPYLDQAQILVGGKPHNIMAFMTQHKSGKNIPITLPLTNPTNTEKRMKVTYTLSSWDTALGENTLKTKTEEVILSPRSSKVLTYEVEFPSLPVYNLRVIAEPMDTAKDVSVFREKTISNIRFIVEDLSKPRLNFVGVDAYPLTSGKEVTLVTCFHNTSAITDTGDIKIETTLYDQDGDEIAKTVYDGSVVPDITGLVKKFTPKDTLSEFTIESKIINQDGALVDSVTKKYTCQDIDLESCQQAGGKEITLLPQSPRSALPIIALIVIILIGGSVLFIKRNK